MIFVPLLAYSGILAYLHRAAIYVQYGFIDWLSVSHRADRSLQPDPGEKLYDKWSQKR